MLPCILVGIALCFCRKCHSVKEGSRKILNNQDVKWQREENTSDGKVHVVWHVDIEKALEMLGPSGVVALEDGSTNKKDLDTSEEQAASGRKSRSRPSSARQACPFDIGSRVEFFSQSRHLWVTAFVKDAQFADPRKENMQLTVKLPLEPLPRVGVQLWQLRAPFVPGELVDFFSPRHKTWLSAVTSGTQPRCVASVRLLDRSDGCWMSMLGSVPLERVRRRFPPSSAVEVYEGGKGWLLGEVEPGAGNNQPVFEELADKKPPKRGISTLTLPATDLSVCEVICAEFGFEGFMVHGGSTATMLTSAKKGDLVPSADCTTHLCSSATLSRALHRGSWPEGACPDEEWLDVAVKFWAPFEGGRAVNRKVVPSHSLRLTAAFQEQVARAEHYFATLKVGL